jgi:hypothetical protein
VTAPIWQLQFCGCSGHSWGLWLLSCKVQMCVVQGYVVLMQITSADQLHCTHVLCLAAGGWSQGRRSAHPRH